MPTRRSAEAVVPRWSARALLLAWSIPVALATPLTTLTLRASGQTVAFWRVAVTVAASWYVWAAMTPIIVRLAERERLERPLSARVSLIHLGAALLACAGQALTTTVAIETVGPPPGATFAAILIYWFFLLLPAGVIVYSAVVGFRTAELNRAEAADRERQAQRLAAQLSEAQLAALRSQIQPHFLFNTLNAVIALVRDHENDRAVEALPTLGTLLRTALRTGSTHEITLADEVAFTTRYVAIEQLRFGDRVSTRIDVPETLGPARVPSFLLQPFVENAFRHGLRDHLGHMCVEISARREDGRLIVMVADDGGGLPSDWEDRSAAGFGIANSKARLRQLYGSDASLTVSKRSDPNRTCVEIVLPFRDMTRSPSAAGSSA
jgi:signal transduction histidine kinase